MRMNLLTAAGVAGLALALTACGSGSQTTPGSAYAAVAGPTSPAATPSPHATASTVLSVRKTSIGNILVDGGGWTLYWYGKDVKGSGRSACTATCQGAWPPATGKPAAAPGVRLGGALGWFTRPGGVIQATYDGYPLYTYAGDTAPGQLNGNGSGGVWHVITGRALTTGSGW